jgi:hypothetical protein
MQDFFTSVQQRRGDGHRLTAVVADELPLLIGSASAAHQFIENLTTLRSKRTMIWAATQGYANFSDSIGARTRRTLLTNFGTMVFLRCREDEVSEFAEVELGYRHETIRRPRNAGTDKDWLDPIGENKSAIRWTVPVAPRGALGRLAPHQGFVVLPNG